MHVCVDWEWADAGEVTLDGEGKLRFPLLPTAPGIYRLRLVGPSTTTYVGEAASLLQRAGNYRGGYAGQPTSHRLNRRMREHLATGNRIEIAVSSHA